MARRKMIIRQQVSDVFSYGYITTTKTQGKATQRCLERLITLSKRGTLSDKRRIASVVLSTSSHDKDALLRKIFTEISDRYRERNGGYSRILKLESKDMVLLSLV